MFVRVIPELSFIFLPITLISLQESLSTLSTEKFRASFYELETSLYLNSFSNEFSGNGAKIFNGPEADPSNCTILDSWVFGNFT